MSKNWKWFLPGYLIALFNTLVGLLICIVYRSHSFKWSDGCLECIGGESGGTTRIWGKPGAQTHGWLIIYADERMRGSSGLRIHERVHVVQGFVAGPVFMLAYGVCFLWYFAAGGFKDWYSAYLKNPFERQAYAALDRGAWGAFR